MDVALVYFKDDGERKDFVLKEGKTVIGRKEDCDYRIPLNQVSREHCQFELDDDGVALRDLGSSNGTYVNNKRIAEAQLKPGDVVIIGPVVFIVQIDGNPTEPKPVKTRVEEREAPASGEDIADDILDMDEEDEYDEDDETRKTDLAERHADDHLDETDFIPAADSDSKAEGDDPLSQALEALASGGEDDDPFADLEDEDEK
jgi:pSer/pThr/pTyr-binding forkhead associated (FHA) protein